MENLEKENIIILAADKLSKSYIGKDKKNNKLILIAGAFMPETKEYWQQGMYSEDEMKRIVNYTIGQWISENERNELDHNGLRFHWLNYDLLEWIKINIKK